MNCCPTIPVAPSTPTSIRLDCMISCRVRTPAKKKPAALVQGPAGVVILFGVSATSRAHTHTGGPRIRFVRFRQNVWRVVQIVTIVRQYNGRIPYPSTIHVFDGSPNAFKGPSGNK